MNDLMLHTRLLENGWTDYSAREIEVDLKENDPVQLFKNEIAQITDLNILVEVEIVGDILINPFDILKSRQIVIAGELFESFETTHIQTINSELFTYQLKLRRKPIVQGTISINGNALKSETMNGLTCRLISGYALITIISHKENV